MIVVSADIQTSSHDLVQAAGAARSSTSRGRRGKCSAPSAGRSKGSAEMELTAGPAGRADRAAEHRVRPRGGLAVEADRPPRHARSAAGHGPSDRRARPSALQHVIDEQVASVHQIFSGPVAATRC